MDLTQQLFDLASTWPGTFRLILLALVAVATVWGSVVLIVKLVLPGVSAALRGLLRGKKLTTPIGSIEDDAPASEAQTLPEPLPMEKVDEYALANPSPVARVMSRQLVEMFDALRGVTQIVSSGLQEEDTDRLLSKRDHIRTVWDSQHEAIIFRLIHNGLDTIQDKDEDAYCRDKSERLFHAFKDSLEERLLSRSVDRIDIHDALRTQGPLVLDRLRAMWATCIKIAKTSYGEAA